MANKDISTFAARLVKRARSLDRNLQQAFRETCATALVEVVKTTPVDTGEARGAWSVGTNGPAPRPPEGFTDKEGDQTIREGLVEIRQVTRPDQTVRIENHAPHISELNRGSSKQAPAGFVDKALMKARATFRLRSFLADFGKGGRA